MSEQSKTKYDTLKQPAQSKQMLAYQQIKEDILNNTFPEGTVMVERKLCDIYQVSRSPIRNALQQLTHEGLLSFVPAKALLFPLSVQRISWKFMTLSSFSSSMQSAHVSPKAPPPL